MENMAFDFRYTLCFLTRDDQVLMLHRRNPPNQGLWNGVGGHLEVGEAPTACVLREVREETGFILPGVIFRGVLTWDGFETPPGGLYIFTAKAPPGEPPECSEGILAWRPREWVFSSPEVVSNIHVFGSRVLGDAPLQRYHFSYNGGNIQHFHIEPLSASLNVG